MYGRTSLANNSVFPTRVSADGSPKYKAGGGTVNWANVTAVSGSDVTLPDGSVIKIGQKYLRYGQVMCKETTGETQTITSTHTSGSGTISLVYPHTGTTYTTGSVAFNASAATILAALQAVLPPNTAVASSGGPLNTTPVVITFTSDVPLMTFNAGTWAGGAISAAATTNTGTTGFFGPYDPGASDGRQTLTRGDCFILDETVLQYPTGSALLGPSSDQVGSLIEGGDVFVDRVMHSGGAAASLALGPTLANLTTAFPRVSFVRD
jgi:hypothetical protein